MKQRNFTVFGQGFPSQGAAQGLTVNERFQAAGHKPDKFWQAIIGTVLGDVIGRWGDSQVAKETAVKAKRFQAALRFWCCCDSIKHLDAPTWSEHGLGLSKQWG